MKTEFETTTYEVVAPHIAKIMQNRPNARNAQNNRMTYDLNACFDLAARDEDIKVVLFGGEGPHFSSGHDLRGFGPREDTPVGTWVPSTEGGVHSRYSFEQEVFLGMCRRWRDFPKPTIAMVQGKTIAGGLMLAWVCDIIIASDDAQFMDPVVNMGVCGVEYFNHPYELGIRKAKELLFTADWWNAEEAKRLGMVNHVVPRAELEEFSLAMAKRIAEKPAFALKLTKQAVNTAQNNMGQQATMDTVLALHHMCHAHNYEMETRAVRREGVPEQFRDGMKAAE
ncbi:MAG: enoyl-CoA hydratase [Sphingomonadales bacterium]